MTPAPPAVVLGGVGGTLSMVRSLSRHGARVHVLGDAHSLVKWSRHCDEFVDLGSDEGAQDRWLEWLDGGPAGAVVLPSGDDGVELVARNRSWLEGRGYLPMRANDDVLLAMLDKLRTAELAARAGVPCPATVGIRSADDAERAARTLGFPQALKPLHSHVFSRHFDTKVFVVSDRAELTAAVERAGRLGIELLATEIIPGPEDSYRSYYTYVDDRGEPLFHLTKRKLRQYPVGFGFGTYHVTDWSPEVAEMGERFCRGVGIRGPANVEFKRDARDGRLKLIECNHRFTAVNEIVRLAGIDLAVLAYDDLLGQAAPRGSGYRVGVRLWSPIEDFRAARDLRRAGELSLPGWARSVARRQHPYFFDWRDPGPTLRSLGMKVWRRTVGKTRKGAIDPASA